MATTSIEYFDLLLVLLLVAGGFFEPCFCARPKHFGLSALGIQWSPAEATWYGSPDGAGSDGNLPYICVCVYAVVHNCLYVQEPKLK